jgi:hypothetical protein
MLHSSHQTVFCQKSGFVPAVQHPKIWNLQQDTCNGNRHYPTVEKTPKNVQKRLGGGLLLFPVPSDPYRKKNVIPFF